jgi:hypothetical protein
MRRTALSGALSFSPKAPLMVVASRSALRSRSGWSSGKSGSGQKETNLRRNVWPYDPILLKHLDHAVAQ